MVQTKKAQNTLQLLVLGLCRMTALVVPWRPLRVALRFVILVTLLAALVFLIGWILGSTGGAVVFALSDDHDGWSLADYVRKGGWLGLMYMRVWAIGVAVGICFVLGKHFPELREVVETKAEVQADA